MVGTEQDWKLGFDGSIGAGIAWILYLVNNLSYMNRIVDSLFGGRINRSTYSMSLVLVGILMLLEQLITVAEASIDRLIGLLYLFVLVPLAISVGARRAHDLGLSGWLVLLLQLVPLINFGVAVLPIVKRGQQLPNRYGSIPGAGVNWRAIFTPWRALPKAESIAPRVVPPISPLPPSGPPTTSF